MKYLMMVGIPTSGKSTYVRSLFEDPYWQLATLLSTDNYLEEVAKNSNSTYNEIFDDYIKHATKKLNEDLENALKYKRPIIHDQTNLTKKSREKKLAKIPKDYQKIAVYSEITLEEAIKRNKTRPGNVIPQRVFMQMLEDYKIPTMDEGFDLIMRINEHTELAEEFR